MDPRELTGLMNIVSPGASVLSTTLAFLPVYCVYTRADARDSKKVNDLRTEEHGLDYNYYFSVGLETRGYE